MANPRVRIAVPPGDRSCGGHGSSEWMYARNATGALPFLADLEQLKGRFPSAESRAQYMEHIRERMALAAAGRLPWDMVEQMQIAPDVLEIKLDDWWFSGGPMHVRLYFSEPWGCPANLVALRLKAKRPGPIGLDEQTRTAMDASALLFDFHTRGYQ